MRQSTVLFYGPPGCGKTLFANHCFARANEFNEAGLMVKLMNSDILEDPFTKLKNLFNTLESFQIRGLLIEDIDIFLPNLKMHTAAHQLLMERIKQSREDEFIIATARRPETLAPEDLDAFQAILPILYPDTDDRLDILNLYIKEATLEKLVNLQLIASATEWWSCGELRELVVRSKKDDNTISNDDLAFNYDNISQGINFKQRIQRTLELLEFTELRCNVRDVREELLRRFSKLLKTSSHNTTISAVDSLKDNYLKSEIERALDHINLENVDLGLFQLAKIFENELWTLLSTARGKGNNNISQQDLQSLSNMINAVVKIGVTKKQHLLTLLREQRNERAHGRVPNQEDRERLLQHAPYLRDLYIEYILLFHQERRKLESS